MVASVWAYYSPKYMVVGIWCAVVWLLILNFGAYMPSQLVNWFNSWPLLGKMAFFRN